MFERPYLYVKSAWLTMVIPQLFFAKILTLPFSSGSPCSSTWFEKVKQEAMNMSRCWKELKCLMDIKDGNSKNCISSQPRRLDAWFTRLVWHCLNTWEGRVVPYGWKTRCCVVYYVFRRRLFFFTLKNKLHLPSFFVLCSFSLSFFFSRKKEWDTIRVCYLQVLCFFSVQVYGGFFWWQL